MTVNPSTMRLGIASILVGLVGACGRRQSAHCLPTATASLHKGRKIRRGDIGFVPMTKKEMKEKNWDLSKVMLNEDQIIGRTIKAAIPIHDPFFLTSLELDDFEPALEVREGYRAAQVRVSKAAGGHADGFGGSPIRAYEVRVYEKGGRLGGRNPTSEGGGCG